MGVFLFAAVVFLGSVWALHAAQAYRHGSFKAFYCAGKVVAQKHDPYRVEPLQSCQRSSGSVLDPGEVEPAPLPGYALAPFALLSRLSFAQAAAVFSICAAAATIVAAVILASMTGLPAGLLLLLLAPLALLNIAYSELPVFAMAALVIAGWAIKTERWTLAAIAAAVALIQPQIAAPLIVSLLILVPRTRIALICCLLALAAISIATTGAANNIEYFRDALPAQAASELVAADQYNVSHQLYVLGVSAKVAMLAAQAWTVFMAIVGIAAAYYARKRLSAPEMAAFLPTLAVMLGGVYLHDVQFIAALPAAVVAAARVERDRRLAAWLALTALAVVWTQAPRRGVVAIDVLAAIAAALLFIEMPTLARVALGAAKGLAAGVAICAVLILLHGGDATATVVQGTLAPAPNDLAANAWAAYLRADPARSTESFLNVVTKLPTWLALVTVLTITTLPRQSSRAFAD